MGYYTNIIEAVWAEMMPTNRLGDNRVAGTTATLLVGWQSETHDRLFQVYVDGELAGVTVHPDERQLIVDGDGRSQIAVVGVDYEDYVTDFGSVLQAFSKDDAERVVFQVPRYGCWGYEAQVQIYYDYQSGAIDEDVPWIEGPLWDEGIRWGWGMEGFGQGDWGYSGTGSMGWGRGLWGEGEWGLGGEIVEWRSPRLALGRHCFRVQVVDAANGVVYAGEVVTVSVDPYPSSVMPRVISYDADSQELITELY